MCQVEPFPVEAVFPLARCYKILGNDLVHCQAVPKLLMFQEWCQNVLRRTMLVVFQVLPQTQQGIHGLELQAPAALEEPLPPGVLAFAIEDMVW